MSLNFSTVMVNSGDPSKLKAFYGKVFGEPMWDQDGFTGWQVGGGHFMVGPHDQVSGNSKEPARIMVNFETDDVEGEFERIKGLGATVVSEPAHPGGEPSMTLACLADPEGNYFQLASPMPDDMGKKE